MKKELKVQINDRYVCPDKIYNTPKITLFYLYKAPNNKCRHSIGKLDEKTQDEMFDCFLRLNNITKSNCKMLKTIRETSLKNMCLNGNVIDVKDNRIICNISKENKKFETCYESLIRHIRNAIAHGNICVCSKKIILTDLKPKDKNNDEMVISARMIIDKQSLVKFKDLLEERYKTTN